MLAIRSNLRSIIASLPLRRRSSTSTSTSSTTGAASRSLDKAQLHATGPLAEKLAATGIWVPSRTGPRPKNGKSSKGKVKGDRTRLNIVSEKLCDDIFSYIGSSLKRHRGCDIIDIYPGAGLWSQKLHNYLKPRSHILMEPDSDLYKPFLKPLLDKPNTTLVPTSGIVWRELNSVLTPEYLPRQTVPDAARLTKRNDTLLVTANIAFHPRKRFSRFESMASLLLYQFIESIRTSGLFQRYGLVRMLIWTRHDDKWSLLPKVMQKRRKLALDSELTCEWVHEVCGREGPDSVWFVRDSTIDASSNLATYERMKAAGIRTPSSRATLDLEQARSASRAGEHILPGSTPPVFRRPYQDTLDELELAHEKKMFPKNSAEYKTMRGYRWRANWEERKHDQILELITRLDAINALHKSGKASPEEIEKLEAEWTAAVQSNNQGLIDEFITYKDNLHYYRQDPPLLNWDRRAYDVMAVEPEEFFPNIQCSLLDIQPKEIHPLLRQTGLNSSRAGDSFDLIMSSMMAQSTVPMARVLDALAPGAADYIMPRWKSIKDLDRGGVVTKTRYAELTPRMLNARQWEELLELWMEWPFRPEYHELIARTHDEPEDEDTLFTE